jgi:hypothetical protein
MSKFLTRDDILSADDMKTEEVEVPEWGGCLNVRSLTGTERDTFEASLISQKGKGRAVSLDNLRAKLVALTAIDEKGKRIFTDFDIVELGKKSAAALDRVFDKAQELSGLKQTDIEELTKNSEAIPGDGSSSD